MTGISETQPKRIELTARALILGSLLGIVFTAANVYLGLQVGLTFASAIPAAVISMALLRAFKTSTIWENMTVQTVASVGGAMSSIIFVLPGLVMIGWWKEFPFWQCFLICAFGGVLGVTFSIPLRRALVINTDLPYPEGVAAAEVLKVGSRGADQTEAAVRENKAGLLTVVVGSLGSAVYAFLVSARAFAGEASAFFRIGPGATGIAGGMQLALLGAGHLVGLAVGLAMFTGLLIAWAAFVPIMTAMQGTEGWPQEAAEAVWGGQVRRIGAGAIGVAAVWTLLKLLGPLVSGVMSAFAAQRRRAANEVLELTERDIPIGLVGIISAVTLGAIGVLLWTFTQGTPLQGNAPAIVAGGVLYVVIIGLVVASVCGYMAGLIGSSNSPVSGVGILAVLVASVLMLGAMQIFAIPFDGSIVAFALLITSVVFAVAVISNDNLQDLKTGQLVAATPWRQQTALIVGVLAGSLVIPFLLNLLNSAFGFAGGPPATVVGTKVLDAPQATLISALAAGVIGGNPRWDLLGIGAILGVGIIIVDEVLARATKRKLKLPPLAVGIGIYLPMGVTTTVTIGAIVGAAYDRWVGRSKNPQPARRLGILMASGLIVGESLFNVLLAGLIVATGNKAPFGFVPEKGFWTGPYPMIAGVVAFLALVWTLYAWTKSKADKI